MKALRVTLAVAASAVVGAVQGQSGAAPRPDGAPAAPFTHFIQLPGPNPILTPGAPGAWDSGVVEAADAFEDFGSYYLYYHATGRSGYQLGVATANHPLGPFHKHPDNPVLKAGQAGSWDDQAVACAYVMRQGPGRYLMWYSGRSRSDGPGQWSIGLATAPGPAGPWQKWPGNPILKGFGYVGAVVKQAGQYWLYAEHPIGQTGPDYGPLSLAAAKQPEGPWTVWKDNPVLAPGQTGQWDAGGFSESEVVRHGHLFHLFYGGARLAKPRILTRERIGYAFSFDGRRFVKFAANPVARPEREPPAASYSEVHALFELPLIYLYHTTRYAQPPGQADRNRFPNVEHIGVQVLATTSPFQVLFPVLERSQLQAGQSVGFEHSPAVPLACVRTATLTVSFHAAADADTALTLSIYSSPNGVRFDTHPWQTFRINASAGQRVQQTVPIKTGVRCIKVRVSNASDRGTATDLVLTATLSG